MPRAIDLEGVVPLRHHLVHEVGERSGGLHSGRARADDHEVERAPLDELGVVRRFLEQLEDSCAQPLRIGHRIQRQCVLLGAGRAVEVRPRASGDDEVVAGERLPIACRHGLRVRVDPRDLELAHLHRRGLREDRSDGSGDVGGPELGSRDLIEERLELLVVVTVDECHGDVVLRELLRASNTGEAGAHDHHGGLLRFV